MRAAPFTFRRRIFRTKSCTDSETYSTQLSSVTQVPLSSPLSLNSPSSFLPLSPPSPPSLDLEQDQTGSVIRDVAVAALGKIFVRRVDYGRPVRSEN